MNTELGIFPLLLVLAGISIGIAIMIIWKAVKTVGVFHIDMHNPGKDLYLLEITAPLYVLPNSKYVVLKIDPYATLSQNSQGI